MKRALNIFSSIALAACLAGCSMDSSLELPLGSYPVGFSVYTPSTVAHDSRGALLSSETFGQYGVGVFAYHQKAKSNGYPVNFGHDIARTEPNFMYNQKLEQAEVTPAVLYESAAEYNTAKSTTLSDVEFDALPDAQKIKTPATYAWTYTPQKYWPNNPNDQLSFFAYAPYDETTSWDEDMNFTCNVAATKFTKHYYVYPDVEDQKDMLWANPVLDVSKQTTGDQVYFQFQHLGPRLSVTTKCNLEAKSIYVTVDEVTIKGQFNVEGDLVYSTATQDISWQNVERSPSERTYHILTKEQLSDGSYKERQRVTTKEEAVGELDAYGNRTGYMYPLAGTQSITLHATVSQRSSTTDFCKSFIIERTFDAMELLAGKAYNFLLDIYLTPITFAGSIEGTWAVSETPYTTTDQGESWH